MCCCCIINLFSQALAETKCKIIMRGQVRKIRFTTFKYAEIHVNISLKYELVTTSTKYDTDNTF